ncbi:helix-turn-helix transcriptional regulator, partial [Komagataeibacter europaeus]|uniref:helix-turn-helix transcriptional regulator n=1 Tax=Komagataeibacter europaeus TaxID=33995 RepID=UPI0035709BDB
HLTTLPLHWVPQPDRLLSRATIYRHISKGTFSRPRKLSSGTIRWHSGIIEDWINTAGTSGA